MISIKYTPNPNSIQLFVYVAWLDFVWECQDEFTANKSPLTKSIWQIGFITYILVGKDFLVINKTSEKSWDELIPIISDKITQFLETESNIFPLSKEEYEKILKNEQQKIDKKSLSEFDKKILDVLEEKIEPGLALHGGGAEFIGFKDGILTLRLTGACSGCPSSIATLHYGIKQIMQYYFPEIEKVETV